MEHEPRTINRLAVSQNFAPDVIILTIGGNE